MSVRLVRKGSRFVFCLVTKDGDPLPAVWHRQAWRRSTFPFASKPAAWSK